MGINSAIKKYSRLFRHYLTTPAMVRQSVQSHKSEYIDMYYNDVLTLDFDADSVDNDDWVVENNTLRLRQPDKLDRCFYALTLFFTGTELVHGKYRMPVRTKHYVNVRLRSWKTGLYSLKKCSRDIFSPQVIKEFSDNTLYFFNNILYNSNLRGGGATYLQDVCTV